jgi:hypothetical protein
MAKIQSTITGRNRPRSPKKFSNKKKLSFKVTGG